MYKYINQEKIKLSVNTSINETMHVQPNIELIYVLQGEIEITMEDKKTTLQAEDLYIINANKMYQLHTSEDVLFAQITISYELIRDVLKCTDFMFWCDSTKTSLASEAQEVRLLLRKLLDHYVHEQENIANFHHIALCYQLIDYLVMHFLVRTVDRKNDSEEGKFLERINAINEYIGLNYNKALSLQDLSDKLYLSNAYLSRFFKKNMGMNFARYVNGVRLYHAMNDLLFTEYTITKIAYENGFSSLNAFNKAFKEEHEDTPSQFRLKAKKSNTKHQSVTSDKAISKLLGAYLSQHTITSAPVVMGKKKDISCSVTTQEKMNDVWSDMINIGSAEDLLRSEVQHHVVALHEQLGFRYIRFWRPFSKKLFIDVYLQEGEFNFTRLDSIFDFLVEHHMKPHIELGFKPKRIHKNVETALLYLDYETKYIEPMQWGRLIDAFLHHLIKRYGRAEVSTWRLELWFNEWEADVSESMGKYFALFDITYDMARKYSEGISVGGCGISLGYTLNLNREFLAQWAKRKHKPDFLSVMSFAYVQGKENKEVYSKRNTDMSGLLHGLQMMKQEMQLTGFHDTKLIVSEWNLTISDRNHINDSCFKGAYIIKNMIDVYNEIDGIGYFCGSDYLSEYYDSNTMLYGGTGLISKDTIMKPSAYAYSFLHKLYPYYVDKGSQYIISSDRHNSYAIVCHHVKGLNHNYYYTREDKLDRENLWKYFEDQDSDTLRFDLQDVEDGSYQIKIRRVNEEHGSVLDMWAELGFHNNLSSGDIAYIQKHCSPKLFIQTQETMEGHLCFEITLEANEIALIRIGKL